MGRLEFAAAIGKIPLAAWDFIIPHGPLVHHDIRDHFGIAKVAPMDDRAAFAAGAAQVAHRVVDLAVTNEAQGQPAQSWVSEFIDDWCGTKWPRRWPWPWPGPIPDDDPRYKDTLAMGQVVASVVFASAGSRMPDTELGRTFGEGAERLAAAAVGDDVGPMNETKAPAVKRRRAAR